MEKFPEKFQKNDSDSLSDKITYAFPKIKDIDPSCYIDAYSLLLECSQAHTPRSFSIKLLDILKKVCPYDEAVVFFLNLNGKISGYYTINMDEQWVDRYLTYYVESMDRISPDFDMYVGIKENSDYQFSKIIEWAKVPSTEFQADYIDARGLKYSWGFCFFDLLGSYRVIISLDRTQDVPFTENEQNRLKLALPILNNMHRNFFYHGMDISSNTVQTPWKDYHLTAREEEIATMLCQGMTVQNISSALYIAITTTYKHISNIFHKTGVSSQQELIVKLLNQKTQ